MHNHDKLDGQIAALAVAIGVLLDKETTEQLLFILNVTTDSESEELEDRLTSEATRSAFRAALRRIVVSSAYYDAASARQVED